VLSCVLMSCVYGDTILKFTYLYTLAGRMSRSVFVSSFSIPLLSARISFPVVLNSFFPIMDGIFPLHINPRTQYGQNRIHKTNSIHAEQFSFRFQQISSRYFRHWRRENSSVTISEILSPFWTSLCCCVQN